MRARLLVTFAVVLAAAPWIATPRARAAEHDAASIRAAVAAWTTPPPGRPTAARPSGPRLERRLERRSERLGWGLETRVAALHQFAVGIDGGGHVAVDRLLVQANLRYSPKPRVPLTVSFGYRLDAFDFDGGGAGTLPARPWSQVHGVSVAVPLFVPISERWFVLAIPVVRTTVEDGAAWDDGLTFGGILGASYKVSERLRIGPGVGVFGQLEEDPSIVPVLLVDWSITPRLTLRTGRGLGATQGPGVFLEYRPSSCAAFALGGRYDKLRFRLDDHGLAPRGIGEESSLAVVLAARWQATRRLECNASVGVALLGRLRLEDRDGRLLVRDEHDAAPFVGLGFTLRL